MPILNPPPQNIPEEQSGFMTELVRSVYQLFYAMGGQNSALQVHDVTTTERDAIKAADGMIVNNTTTNAFNFYENGAWVTFGGGGGGGENFSNLTTNKVLGAGDTNTVYTNTGAASTLAITLPAGALGLKYTFLLTDADGYAITADGAETVTISGSDASTMTCTQLGGAVVLYGRSGGFIASSSQRTWIDS